MTGQSDLRRTLSRLYSDIKDGTPPRNITFDENGPTALIGSQGTSKVWYAERTNIDEDGMTFRVLLVKPTKSKGVQMSRRTGQPEFGERLTNCQYFVGDVTVPARSHNATLGHVLRDIQEKFRHVMQRRLLDKGNLRSDRDVSRIIDRQFPDE